MEHVLPVLALLSCLGRAPAPGRPASSREGDMDTRHADGVDWERRSALVFGIARCRRPSSARAARQSPSRSARRWPSGRGIHQRSTSDVEDRAHVHTSRQGPLKRREAISRHARFQGPVMPPESPCDDHTTPASPHPQGHASAAQQARVQAVRQFGQRLLQPDAGQSDPWGVVDRTLRRRGAEPAVPGRQCRLDRGQAKTRSRACCWPRSFPERKSKVAAVML